uniref:ORF1 n=1 Tax=Carnobacterium divergens TaxID=2748 RepID=Q46598_CARDV|nr:ORF1 [Carnobacterium divergens]
MEIILNMIVNNSPVERKKYLFTAVASSFTLIIITSYWEKIIGFQEYSTFTKICILIVTAIYIFIALILISLTYRRMLQLKISLRYMILLLIPVINLIFSLFIGVIDEKGIAVLKSNYNLNYIEKKLFKYSTFYAFSSILLLFIFPNTFTQFINDQTISGNIHIYFFTFLIINIISVLTDILLNWKKLRI